MENAIINSVFVGLEGHRIPTFMIEFSFDNSVQSFGGYDLRYKDTAARAKGVELIAIVAACEAALGIQHRKETT